MTWGACTRRAGTRALESAIGLPSRSPSASGMLALLIPAEVRRHRMLPSRVSPCTQELSRGYGTQGDELGKPGAAAPRMPAASV